MRKPHLLAATACILLLPACAAQDDRPATTADHAAYSPSTGLHPVEARLAYEGKTRGGAAYRAGGYVHVFATAPDIPSSAPAIPPSAPQDGLSPDGMAQLLQRLRQMEDKTPLSPNAQVTAHPATPPEPLAHHPGLTDRQKEAWRRWCQARPQMTPDDWGIVHATTGPTWFALEHYRRQDCSSIRNEFVGRAETAGGISAEPHGRPATSPAPAANLYPAAASDPDCHDDARHAGGSGCAVR